MSNLQASVDQIVDYAYTSEEPDLNREGDNRVQLALEFLLLAHHWEMVDAQRVMQDIIIKLKMVDPFKLDISTRLLFCQR